MDGKKSMQRTTVAKPCNDLIPLQIPTNHGFPDVQSGAKRTSQPSVWLQTRNRGKCPARLAAEVLAVGRELGVAVAQQLREELVEVELLSAALPRGEKNSVVQ